MKRSSFSGMSPSPASLRRSNSRTSESLTWPVLWTEVRMSKVGSRSTTYWMKWSVNCQPIGEGENPLLSHGSGALNPTVGGTTPVVQKSMPPRLKSSTPCGPAEIAHGLAGIDDVAVIVAQRRQVFLQRVGLARCQAGRVAAGAGGGDEALGVERAFGRVLDELVDHAVRRVAAVVHGGIDQDRKSTR